MIDHGTGVVIGETSVIEDDVSMLQGVTLGGTGKEQGDRHPKVRRGVMIGAGAKILGNLEIGAYSRVGAGSVVLKDVPERCTVAGVPAKVVGCAGCDQPAREMNQIIEDAPGRLSDLRIKKGRSCERPSVRWAIAQSPDLAIVECQADPRGCSSVRVTFRLCISTKISLDIGSPPFKC